MSKKKGRIAITTLAGCIGITGFALIMGLGNGANIYIDKQLNKFANSDVLMVSKNVKESNDMGSYTTISSDEKDYKKIFEMEEVKASRPMINTNNVKINVGNQESEMVAYSLGNETSEFLKENVDGKLPLKNEILVNQAAAREILKLLNIESKDIKDAIGKEVTFLINVTKDNLEKVTVNENFVVSGVVNELDFDISSIYYNYDAFKEILNETFLTTGTLYDYLTNNSGFEIILKDASDNKLVTNEITAEKNGGAGNILSVLSGGTQKEGFMAYNIPVIMKLQFEQLIFIAQIVISIFIIVALVVSSIMTSIVLYSSIVERKTEIGIIKAVGGRDKDVLRIFESEAILMGLFSGVLGVIIAFVLKYPIESLIAKLLGFKLPGIVTIPLSQVPFTNVTFPLATIITLILFSAIISAIAGYLPSKKATKMQVIDALREE
jgi:ABC-type antimicrobial peptide transport system permease subunit